MDYPIRFAPQAREHLRALRKARKLTQRQLGALVGMTQARIADIEANPAVVSLEVLLKLFTGLGAELHIKDPTGADNSAPDSFEMRDMAKRLGVSTDALLDAIEQIRATQASPPPSTSPARPPRKGRW